MIKNPVKQNLLMLPLFLIGLQLVIACARTSVEPGPVAGRAVTTTPAQTESETEETLIADARRALASQNDRRATQLYETYLTRFPQGKYGAEVLMQRGVIAETKGDLDGALSDFGQLAERYPQSPWMIDAQLKRMEILFKQQKYDQVIHQVDRTLSLVRDDFRQAKIYRILGDTHVSQAAYLSALRAYARAYNLSRDDARKDIAVKLKATARQLDTIRLRSILTDLPQGPARGRVLFLLGKQLMDEGKYSDARKVFSEFVETYPHDPQGPKVWGSIADLKQIALDRDTIGCLFPLSGPYRQFGTRALNGVELALHQFTAGSLHSSVRIIVKDTGADPEKALTAFQELVDADVAAIIGPMVTAETVAKQAQALGIPLVTLTQKEGIPQMGDYIFRNYITPQMQTEALVDYAVTQLGVTRFAVLYPSEKYGITFMHHFWDSVIAHGAELTKIESYDPNRTDFANTIKRLISQPASTKGRDASAVVDFQALFIPDAPEKAGLLIPQLAYHDIRNVYLLGTNLWYSKRLIEMAGQFVGGSIFPVGFYPEASSWVVDGFLDEFTSAFGNEPGFIEAVAYDTAKILFQIISSSDASYRSLIRDELLRLSDYPGVTGITSLRTDGDVEKRIHLLSIKGNRFIELGQ